MPFEQGNQIINSFIENKLQEFGCDPSNKFFVLYSQVKNEKLKLLFSSLHAALNELIKKMNTRIPGGHFWANESRYLLWVIQTIYELHTNLANTQYAFDIDTYYQQFFTKSQSFLRSSNGSQIPDDFEKVQLYHIQPIFRPLQHFNSIRNGFSQALTLIGEGSYAQVYKYNDTLYDKTFVLKRAKRNLSSKEIERFKLEFTQMKKLKSPYIVEVYSYDEENNQYIMEFMDCTLLEFMRYNNANLNLAQRKNIINQILKGFSYIHAKKLFHRDISPCNILIKKYEYNVNVIKISDFGLVKYPESTLTTAETDFKGVCNDPALRLCGFKNYDMAHEIYALTHIIMFVLTGKQNFQDIKNNDLREFLEKGQNPDTSKRFKTITELMAHIPYNALKPEK